MADPIIPRRHILAALKYAALRRKPTLEQAIRRDRDIAMARYLLDRHADKWDAFELGRALMWASVAAPDDPRGWLDVVTQIAAHARAVDICPSMIQQTILQSAQHHDIALARFLFTQPQVQHISRDGWKDVLMEVLPKGHPYKRVIEKRDFDDKDGCPEILAMVEQFTQKHKKAPSGPAKACIAP